MQIPIENIYYLLCYAWDKLEESDLVSISIDDKINLVDLFAKILINATKKLLKNGIDRNYIDYNEEISGIKGKVQISQTLKRNLQFRLKTICTYDDFSSNIISNRILVTTIYRLTKTKGISPNYRNELISLFRMFFNIEQIEITNSLFKLVKIHRNNHFYGFLMNVCQIIHEHTLPSEDPGKYNFSDFTKDEKKMHQLFEGFVRNFYRIEQNTYEVRREIIKWKFEVPDNENSQFVPEMKTDITLEDKNKKIIIDTKFYKETMVANRGNDKIISAHLYQLFSYLMNQQNGELKTQEASGILLYPTINCDYNLDYLYNKHLIKIRTVNLNTNWKKISSRLLTIIGIENTAKTVFK